jgi:hypothetical protein
VPSAPNARPDSEYNAEQAIRAELSLSISLPPQPWQTGSNAPPPQMNDQVAFNVPVYSSKSDCVHDDPQFVANVVDFSTNEVWDIEQEDTNPLAYSNSDLQGPGPLIYKKVEGVNQLLTDMLVFGFALPGSQIRLAGRQFEPGGPSINVLNLPTPGMNQSYPELPGLTWANGYATRTHVLNLPDGQPITWWTRGETPGLILWGNGNRSINPFGDGPTVGSCPLSGVPGACTIDLVLTGGTISCLIDTSTCDPLAIGFTALGYIVAPAGRIALALVPERLVAQGLVGPERIAALEQKVAAGATLHLTDDTTASVTTRMLEGAAAEKELAAISDASTDEGSRKVLVVGEADTLEYSVNLALRNPTWQITATTLGPAPAGMAGQLPSNLVVMGGVNATKLNASFSANTFDDVVFNAPRSIEGWRKEAGDLVDNVLVSARDVVRPGGTVRFSTGGGMPATLRLQGHAGGGTESFPLPTGYSAPSVRPFLSDPEFGVPYTIRNNSGSTLRPQPPLNWYIFSVP